MDYRRRHGLYVEYFSLSMNSLKNREGLMEFHSVKSTQINTHQIIGLMNTYRCIRQIGHWGD